jgi:hypothetical protein
MGYVPNHLFVGKLRNADKLLICPYILFGDIQKHVVVYKNVKFQRLLLIFNLNYFAANCMLD